MIHSVLFRPNRHVVRRRFGTEHGVGGSANAVDLKVGKAEREQHHYEENEEGLNDSSNDVGEHE